MSPILKNVLQLLLFLSIGLGIMYFLYDKNQAAYLEYCAANQIPQEKCSLLDKLRSDFGSLNYFWIAMIFVGFGMTNYSRAKRWQIILKTLDYDTRFVNAFAAVNVAYLANLGLPRIGEFVRAAIFSKYEKLPVDKVFGTVVIDRIADMISFFLLVLLAYLLDRPAFHTFFSDYAHMPEMGNKVYYLGLLVLLAGAAFYFREAIMKWRWMRKISGLITGVWEGVIAIRNLQARNQFFLHTLLIWIWFFLMFVFACKAFPPTSQLALIPMLVVYVFGSFGVFIPSPGGMGTYHFMVILGLGLYGIHQTDAFSFANIAFASAQFFALVIYGVLSLIVLQLYNKPKTA
ncbi:MAG TPA: lysylphosphatidylglycerol synthase transmembrane domain-containing protein [Saprospiraceae bacterium]|nr:lysylphosphatidylglycerol synthase transmembrane domain-containing protein [Saprospiraceae bacterium]